ncbi:hypothetical protein FJ987_09535 [Mesorhizobium sp. CU2]|uniref:hypothetical protein n=1 Tax=unclassified Mesorhizobium TaxID=325217 RepID=UPI001128A0AB|nr:MULTISPECIES: hypothetical protein [unclassified Mesorhizobium]TPN86397.1 hypothetical protein FJ988_06300 [Mesorhizobium sp. CU3]TPO17176.1 hypothetical protein FJ987_09535 [Mesorhizobium sp. CU2]
MWVIRIARDALAWIGLLTIFAIALALSIGPTWCLADNCSVQGWLSALSGWAGAIAAASTIGMLWRQSSEAVRSADIGQSALEHDRETSRTQLRAYVFLENADLNETERYAMLTFRNLGATPARNVKLTADVNLVNNRGIYEKISIEGLVENIPPIGQSDVFEHRIALGFINTAVAIEIRQGDTQLTISGDIKYEDVFGDSHTTGYAGRSSVHDEKILDRMDTSGPGNFSD